MLQNFAEVPKILAMPKIVTPLKLAIVASGRTQREIAEQVGLDEWKLSRIVNGLHCDDATQRKIAAALGLTVSSLFDSPETERAA